MEILFANYKGEKLENYKGEKLEEKKVITMEKLWQQYTSSKDINLLAEAAEAAPFFGQTAMAKEIGRILREYIR